MISFIIFLTFTIAAFIIFFGLGDSRYTTSQDRHGDTRKKFNPNSLLKPILVFIIGILVAAIQPFALEKIDAGNVGLKVRLTGDDRGVSKNTYVSGWNMYNTWSSDLKQYPITIRPVEYPVMPITVKGGFSADIHPSFTYQVNPSMVSDMFKNLRRPIEEIEQGFLKLKITTIINDVANSWTMDSIFNNKVLFEKTIVKECNVELSKWFNITGLRTNLIPPPSLQEAIEQKTNAIQKAQAAIQRKEVAIAEAQEKIAIAKGDSAQAVISASGKAKANSLLQQSLTPMLLQRQWIEAWKDGGSQVPTYISGAGSDKFMMTIK
jgi:regulator of protease activity HflC (stomatin/prohibitin superfamily)